MALSRPALSAGLDVELDLGALPPVRCEPQKLVAALASVLRRAGASAHQRSKLRVRTARTAAELRIEVTSFATNLAEDVELVSDGMGVTTASWDLMTARHCVSELQGTLDVVSAHDAGTTWRIHLSLQDDSVAAA